MYVRDRLKRCTTVWNSKYFANNENGFSCGIAYPAEDASFADESCCTSGGGTGEPPLSSDGVFDKNKLPPNSETSVMGELSREYREGGFYEYFLRNILVNFFVNCVCVWESVVLYWGIV